MRTMHPSACASKAARAFSADAPFDVIPSNLRLLALTLPRDTAEAVEDAAAVERPTSAGPWAMWRSGRFWMVLTIAAAVPIWTRAARQVGGDVRVRRARAGLYGNAEHKVKIEPHPLRRGRAWWIDLWRAGR